MDATAQDIFVEANGIRHHLLSRGTPGAPVVMMLHGLAQQAHVFDGLATRLAEDYHVLGLDVRGHGDSGWGPPDDYTMKHPIDDLEAVRDVLGIERFMLVGLSFGGLICTNHAARYPERVTKLVINDVGPEMPVEGRERLAAMPKAPRVFPDLDDVRAYFYRDNPAILGGRDHEEALEYSRWHVQRDDGGAYTWKMDPAARRLRGNAAPPRPPWDVFEAVRCPTLVVRGAVSDVLSAETAANMVSRGRDCRMVEVPDVGHTPTLVEPESLGAIEPFLADR